MGQRYKSTAGSQMECACRGARAGLFSLALLQIGTNATSPETARIAYLFALTVFLPVPYLVISGVMMVLSLNNMIRRGLRGERA